MNVAKRVAELERHAGTQDQLTVIITMVSPSPNGAVGGPMGYKTSAYCKDQLRWDQMPGETLERLLARATAEVPRNAQGVATLMECSGKAEL
jgi:hypothetical protein